MAVPFFVCEGNPPAQKVEFSEILCIIRGIKGVWLLLFYFKQSDRQNLLKYVKM